MDNKPFNFDFRNSLFLCFVVFSCSLAVVDKEFRVVFGDLARMVLTGYYAQLKP